MQRNAHDAPLFQRCFFAAGVSSRSLWGLALPLRSFGQMVREYFDVLAVDSSGHHHCNGACIFFALSGLAFCTGSCGLMQVRDLGHVRFVGAYVIGLAFAFGWTPCVGPVLAAILFTAAASETALNRCNAVASRLRRRNDRAPFMSWQRCLSGRSCGGWHVFVKHLGTDRKDSWAGFLILFGVLIATNSMNYIAQWMLGSWPRT